MRILPLLPILLLACAGCKTRHAVITTTGNVFGFELAQNPSSGMYQAKLGYARTEFAYVPSNRSTVDGEASYQGGATDVPDVLLELKFQNVFKGGGLYQRLAVGTTAVSQPGAAFMFAKGPDGTLDPVAAKAIGSTLNQIEPPDWVIMDNLAPMARDFTASEQKDRFNEVARSLGWDDFPTFLSNDNLTPDQVDEMATVLRQEGLLR